MIRFTKEEVLTRWRNGCIVSCQALEDEPLHGSSVMALMAKAAEQGGAVGIRANSPEDIRAVKAACAIPVIGLYKAEYPESDVWITPTLREARLVAEAGADALAIDATSRRRPGGARFESIVDAIRGEYPQLLLFADVSTREEGEAAMDAGVDFVSTAIAGYTPYSESTDEPAYALMRELSALGRAPVIAEGRVWTREQAVLCLEAGAYAVVVGTAVTRPREITKRFAQALKEKVDG